MRNKFYAWSVFLILFAIASCTNNKGIYEVVPTISFSREILPILRGNCAINSGCHLGGNNSNRFVNFDDSDAYNTVVLKQLVNSGNPSASLLYVQVNNGIMPLPPASRLPAADIEVILNWIAQ